MFKVILAPAMCPSEGRRVAFGFVVHDIFGNFDPESGRGFAAIIRLIIKPVDLAVVNPEVNEEVVERIRGWQFVTCGWC